MQRCACSIFVDFSLFRHPHMWLDGSTMLNCSSLLLMIDEGWSFPDGIRNRPSKQDPSSIRQKTYLLKKSVNELTDQIANLSIALCELQTEERQLSKEVVHSPDRIKVDLAEATQKLKGIKTNILAKQRERTLASNSAAIICIAVVFNIMCICSMHDLLSRNIVQRWREKIHRR